MSTDGRGDHAPFVPVTIRTNRRCWATCRRRRFYGVYAYGSLAQPGGGSRNSDLDLLIVGDVKDRASMIERLTAVGTRLNRVIDPSVLSPEQFESAKRQQDQHVAPALAGVRIMGNL